MSPSLNILVGLGVGLVAIIITPFHYFPVLWETGGAGGGGGDVGLIDPLLPGLGTLIMHIFLSLPACPLDGRFFYLIKTLHWSIFL